MSISPAPPDAAKFGRVLAIISERRYFGRMAATSSAEVSAEQNMFPGYVRFE